MKPAPFDYHAAPSAAEAVELLARHGDDAKVLAGGQSLVPMLNLRLARPGVLVDINGAADLDYLREADGVLAVGALVRQRALERWAADRGRRSSPRRCGWSVTCADPQSRHGGGQSRPRRSRVGAARAAALPRRRGRRRGAPGASA